MNFVSLGGLVFLLFCAWLLSYHKKKINFRQILWGVGLQFLFAIIILKNDFWSFLGMGVLGLLIVNFILKDFKIFKQERSWMSLGVNTIITIGSGALIYFIGMQAGKAVVTYILLFSLLYLIANAFLKFAPSTQKFGGTLLVVSGITVLIVGGYHGEFIFHALSDKVKEFLKLSDYGARFLFGNLADQNYFGPWEKNFPYLGNWPGFGFQFAFKVLPTIIFFGGFMAVLYYIGVMQMVIEGLSRFMRWTLRTSGAETMSCTSNIFVGQTEAPLLIKPFLEDMTRSELLTIMVGGFATIAGGVLAGYIAMGIPAGHLIAASVMSAPAALVIGKIILPETQHSQTAGDVALPKIKSGANIIEAVSNGILDGLKLAVNVGAMLVGFIALIAVVDWLLNIADHWVDGVWLGGEYVKYAVEGMSPAKGEYTGFFPGSLKTLFGTILRPLAWLMGVPWKDAGSVGNLLGIKLSLNEFVAYGTLGKYILDGEISQRATIIATYALCGFANFSSIGIQIGGISAIAPGRKTDLAKLGLKAMLGGAIASWTTATIAGILL